MKADDIISIVLVSVIVFGIVLIFFIAPAKIRALRKKEELSGDTPSFDEQDEQDECFDGEGIDTEAVGARVISKDFESKVNGTKYVRHSSSFFVTFLTDDGEEKEFKVTRELFDRLYEDQTGTLVTVNGNFFDFGDGEEMSE